MGAAPAIQVNGLRKSYGPNDAVCGIDFEVESGEVFGFLGRNGAGKTTTIEILEGYRERTAGEASVLGADPGRPTREWRDRIGLVLQACELNPTLTVGETLSLYSSFYSRPLAVEKAAGLVGLGDRLDSRTGTLSGGQRRRLDVAVALIGDPDLLFLDEPTTGFDPSARRDSWNMIEGLRELGKTVFLTTHYMDEAQHLSDRVAIPRDGQIVASGSPDELTPRDGATIVSFELPEGVPAEAIGSTIGGHLETSGKLATVRTDDAQRTLYRLTSWAEESGVHLSGLQARRPSLEDVFLELTGGDRG